MNNNKVSLTLLGTATSQGIPVIGCNCPVCTSTESRDQRLRSSALFTVNGKNIAIDSGPDFRQQMLLQNVQRLEAILYTHEHNDHVAGLDDIRPLNFKFDMDMPLYGQERVLNELKKRFGYIFSNYPGVPRITDNVIEGEKPFKVEGIEILPIEVMHGQLPILGYRIHDITYLTDVKTIDYTSLELLKGTRILVINTLREEAHHSHLNLEEALALIEQIQPEEAYLTHISHLFGTHQEIQKKLPPSVFVGYDGLVLA